MSGQSRMEMIYIDTDGQARKTRIGAIMESNKKTWADFRSRKPLAVPHNTARFFLDYYNRHGNLADTIPLSADGFTAITGEQPLCDSDYREIDRKFWEDAKRELRAAKAAGGAA